jgi:hypothetical protein
MRSYAFDDSVHELECMDIYSHSTQYLIRC